jgi:hypothetical protein
MTDPLILHPKYYMVSELLVRHGGVLDSGKPLSKTQDETKNAAPLSRARGA